MAAGAATPPEEVLAPASRREAYIAWRASTDLRAPYRVAPEFLSGTKPDADFDTDEAPLIVFINARSGGRVGAELAGVLARALGRSQVFDLSHHRPDVVLAQIWANFDEQERLGNPRAAVVRSRLRILACGGDGTVAWIMKVVRQLDLRPQPAIAIMPLGTGNDLSRSFHWGAEFEHGWIKGSGSIYSTLQRIADARVADLDCWRLRLVLPGARYKPAHTYAMAQVQQQPQQQPQQQQPGCAGEGGGRVVMEGLFWNYFSVGADAQAAYAFHTLRDRHPVLASSRAANQFWYAALSCTSGWFCGTLPAVSRLGRVTVLQPGASSWSELVIPPSIKALVLVNLQSYGGGRNIWGAHASKHRSWRTPDLADGLIEVVGFTTGYHALAVMGSDAKLARGRRLAQVAGIRLALRDAVARPDGEPGQVFMQLDGEPWLQSVPAGAEAGDVLLEVVRSGSSRVLTNCTAPPAHPVSKVTKLLDEQQQAAYLTDSVQQATPAHAGVAGARRVQPHDAARDEAPAARALPAPQLHVPAGAAHSALAPPTRACATDGGAAGAALASSGAAGAAALQLPPRRSLELQPTGAPAQAAGSEDALPSAATPSSSSHSDMDAPSAVAVIETSPVVLAQLAGVVKLPGAAHQPQQQPLSPSRQPVGSV